MAHLSCVKQLSFSVLKVLRITRVLASGYFIMFVMTQSAMVLDFFEALEPLTALYLP